MASQAAFAAIAGCGQRGGVGPGAALVCTLLCDVATAQPVEAAARGSNLVSPGVAATVMVGALLFAVAWWVRERRIREQRQMMRRSYQLGEEILGASSVTEVLSRAKLVLPSVLGISHVRLYVYDAATRTLDEVSTGPGIDSISIPLNSPSGLEAGAAACFQNRTLLAIPDVSRSPFLDGSPPSDQTPQSVLFVPTFAQREPLGVLELAQHRRSRYFNPDQLALAQHLANQIGAALQLLDQRSVREQLFRSEKLAAVGRLISGVVNELQAPLASICRHAQASLSLPGETRLSRELRAIRSEGQKASDIVARLVSFGKTDHVEATPLDVNQLLQDLLDFRDREWKARGIRVQTLLASQPLYTLGSRGQLEQVFLNLLVHAEQSVTDSTEKMVTVRTKLLAQRILIEIGYSAGNNTVDAFEKLSQGPEGSLDVLRGIMAGHSGELRLVSAGGADPRFEVELPALNREQRQGTANGTLPVQRSVTALVIEPDESVQRHLVSSLGARGFRVIPTENADTGLDLAHRLRFDLAFCSFHAPGLNWVELSEQLQGRLGAFILMPDGYDAELATDFEGEGRFVLPKPIDEDNLDLVLQLIERTLIG